MQLVTFKMGEGALKKLDKAVREGDFESRTEFIRNAIREKVLDIEKELAWRRLMKARGMLKGPPTTDEELERIRERAFEELKKEFK